MAIYIIIFRQLSISKGQNSINTDIYSIINIKSDEIRFKNSKHFLEYDKKVQNWEKIRKYSFKIKLLVFIKSIRINIFD